VRLAENQPVPTEVTWTGNVPVSGAKMKLLSNNDVAVKWKKQGDTVTVFLPSAFRREHESYPALAFQY
jgi:hypothetical protein